MIFNFSFETVFKRRAGGSELRIVLSAALCVVQWSLLLRLVTDVCGVAFRPFVRVEIRFFDRLVSSSSSLLPFFLTKGFCNVDNTIGFLQMYFIQVFFHYKY